MARCWVAMIELAADTCTKSCCPFASKPRGAVGDGSTTFFGTRRSSSGAASAGDPSSATASLTTTNSALAMRALKRAEADVPVVRRMCAARRSPCRTAGRGFRTRPLPRPVPNSSATHDDCGIIGTHGRRALWASQCQNHCRSASSGNSRARKLLKVSISPPSVGVRRPQVSTVVRADQAVIFERRPWLVGTALDCIDVRPQRIVIQTLATVVS